MMELALDFNADACGLDAYGEHTDLCEHSPCSDCRAAEQNALEDAGELPPMPRIPCWSCYGFGYSDCRACGGTGREHWGLSTAKTLLEAETCPCAPGAPVHRHSKGGYRA
jgi:hypothetical protein